MHRAADTFDRWTIKGMFYRPRHAAAPRHRVQ